MDEEWPEDDPRHGIISALSAAIPQEVFTDWEAGYRAGLIKAMRIVGST
jgi:hypothetical protein